MKLDEQKSYKVSETLSDPAYDVAVKDNRGKLVGHSASANVMVVGSGPEWGGSVETKQVTWADRNANLQEKQAGYIAAVVDYTKEGVEQKWMTIYNSDIYVYNPDQTNQGVSKYNNGYWFADESLQTVVNDGDPTIGGLAELWSYTDSNETRTYSASGHDVYTYPRTVYQSEMKLKYIDHGVFNDNIIKYRVTAEGTTPDKPDNLNPLKTDKIVTTYEYALLQIGDSAVDLQNVGISGSGWKWNGNTISKSNYTIKDAQVHKLIYWLYYGGNNNFNYVNDVDSSQVVDSGLLLI